MDSASPTSTSDVSPRYQMPAEWAPHEATWIAWPHNRTDWPGKMAAVHWVYAEIVRVIAPGEIVRILVNSRDHKARATRFLRRVGVDLSRVEFHRYPTDRGWTRDFGPIFVRRTSAAGRLAIVDFRFNAWARYPEWKNDNRIPAKVAKALGFSLIRAEVRNRQFVLEGGAVDVNGNGTLLATEQCLLDTVVQARNPGLSRTDVEAALRTYLGAVNVLWIGQGLAGDDTHGHVDDVCRFVDSRTVVVCQEDDPHDANYRALQENRERLEAMRLEDGSRPQVVPLPMPAPRHLDGERLPASYVNFYVANAAVLVPTFNDPNDRVALGILADLFAPRPVVGIHAVDLVWGLGTLHCMTQQQPAP